MDEPTDSALMSAGSTVFSQLKTLGVDYVFGNSGTDFPPVIEGLAHAAAMNIDLPTPVIAPHEHAAMGMAQGYYYATGRAQAVMLHTNVGLANGAIGAINAACDHTPMIIMSGRTPTTEQDRFGARTVPIGWGQEMRDQTALVREACKWDYELRFPEQIASLLDRGHAIANSTPRGPVYLSLPRETLCEPVAAPPRTGLSRLQPVRPSPDPDALAAAVALLRAARRPLVISQRGVGSADVFKAFGEFVTTWALPVNHYWATRLSLPMRHPMQCGVDPHPWLADADVVLVIDSLAPWSPDRQSLPPGCQVIQLGPDPLFSRTPVRNFPVDVALVGETADALSALIRLMGPVPPTDQPMIEQRRARISQVSEQTRRAVQRDAESGGHAITKDWVSLCLGRAIRGRDARVFSELGCPLAPLDLEHHGSWFQEPYSGGLGWCLPAAMGMQLAQPSALVLATMGDGSYLFANPTACHQIAESLRLPVVTLILNNHEWGAVRQSVTGLYPGGHAVRAPTMPFTGLNPSPDFAMTARASRAHAETVSEGQALPAALDRAIEIAGKERRQVVLDIQIAAAA